MPTSLNYIAKSITWAEANDPKTVDLYKQLTIETLVHKLQDDYNIS